MNIKHYILVGLSLLALASCSEKSDAVEEYPDWKNKNEQFFEAAYLSGDYDLKLRKYSLKEEVAAKSTEYVLVEKLADSEPLDDETPYLTDTVQIHYVGSLLPSTTYTTGYEFDKSYIDPFNIVTAVPRKFAVNAVVPGFATALLHMHRGEHWRVTIPYQLGYGTSANGNIPAYSTLIFEIRLDNFWMKKQGDRY